MDIAAPERDHHPRAFVLSLPDSLEKTASDDAALRPSNLLPSLNLWQNELKMCNKVPCKPGIGIMLLIHHW